MIIYRFRIKNRNNGRIKVLRYIYDRDMLSRFRWIELINWVFDVKNSGNWELIAIEKEVLDD